MALAFDKGRAFGFDKPAGVACPNLDRHHCKIHSELKDQGFHGCIAYGCAGAGQQTLALYGGQSWQDDPDLLPAQMDTFRHLNRLHALMELLIAAGALSLPEHINQMRLDLLAHITPTDITPHSAKTLADGPLPAQINAYLKSLAAFAPKPS